MSLVRSRLALHGLRLLRPFSSSSPLVLCEDSPDGVRTITLNNPAKRNPLSLAVLKELAGHLTDVPPTIGAVVLRGSGPAFSAGHNLREFSASCGFDIAGFRGVLDECCKAMLQVAACPVPTLASVHGVAAAAGCQLVASCDLAIASQSSRFATPGITIGLFCTTPAVPLVRTIGSLKKANEMLYTGDFISADEAVQHGLIGSVVPDAELESSTARMVSHIVRHSRPVLRLGKKTLLDQTGRLQQLETAYKLATEAMLENLRLGDTQRGIDAFLEKKQTQWSHSDEQVL